VARIFPEVPYQYCQTHFLMNCGKPMQPDLTALQTSVRRRADAVREIGKLVAPLQSTASCAANADSPSKPLDIRPSVGLSKHDAGAPLSKRAASREETDPQAAMSEQDLTREVCDLVRVNSRVSGKAPLDPAELKRHERLEELRGLVNEAKKKKSRSSKQGVLARSPGAGA
jgi:hypothetical protein